MMRNSQSSSKNQKHIMNRQIHESKAHRGRITGLAKNWLAKSLEQFVIVGSFRMLETYFADVQIKLQVLFPNAFWLILTYLFRRNTVGSQIDSRPFSYLSQVQNTISNLNLDRISPLIEHCSNNKYSWHYNLLKLIAILTCFIIYF